QTSAKNTPMEGCVKKIFSLLTSLVSLGLFIRLRRGVMKTTRHPRRVRLGSLFLALRLSLRIVSCRTQRRQLGGVRLLRFSLRILRRGLLHVRKFVTVRRKS